MSIEVGNISAMTIGIAAHRCIRYHCNAALYRRLVLTINSTPWPASDLILFGQVVFLKTRAKGQSCQFQANNPTKHIIFFYKIFETRETKYLKKKLMKYVDLLKNIFQVLYICKYCVCLCSVFSEREMRHPNVIFPFKPFSS